MNEKRNYDPVTQFLDITAPQHVEIVVREDEKVVWINIDGFCAVRINDIGNLQVPKKKAINHA